jgi:hypothetical protein
MTESPYTREPKYEGRRYSYSAAEQATAELCLQSPATAAYYACYADTGVDTENCSVTKSSVNSIRGPFKPSFSARKHPLTSHSLRPQIASVV